jgi:hypothetical protein
MISVYLAMSGDIRDEYVFCNYIFWRITIKRQANLIYSQSLTVPYAFNRPAYQVRYKAGILL